MAGVEPGKIFETIENALRVGTYDLDRRLKLSMAASATDDGIG
jgi:hypothetical protein